MSLPFGIHEHVSFSDYLGPDLVAGPAISGSDIANLDKECPAYAHAFWRGNPARVASDDSASMAFGRAAHCLILEGENVFATRYAIKPDGMSFSKTDGIAWRKETQRRGHEIITYADHERAMTMREALESSKSTCKLLESYGKAELTMIAKDPVTGLTLLARPDLLIDYDGLIVNLKTAADPSPIAFQRQAFALRYFLSDAFARLVARGCGIKHPRHSFLVAGSQPPHLGYVANISPEAARWADGRVRELINQFADHISSGRWPGYADDTLELALPSWVDVTSMFSGAAESASAK